MVHFCPVHSVYIFRHNKSLMLWFQITKELLFHSPSELCWSWLDHQHVLRIKNHVNPYQHFTPFPFIFQVNWVWPCPFGAGKIYLLTVRHRSFLHQRVELFSDCFISYLIHQGVMGHRKITWSVGTCHCMHVHKISGLKLILTIFIFCLRKLKKKSLINSRHHILHNDALVHQSLMDEPNLRGGEMGQEGRRMASLFWTGHYASTLACPQDQSISNFINYSSRFPH